MSKNKNARSGGGTPEQACCDKNCVILSDYNKNKDKCQPEIASLLMQGSENAINGADLVSISGISANRKLRAQIARERANGAVILSSYHGRGGYYLPAEGEAGFREVQAFVKEGFVHAFGTIAGLKSALEFIEQNKSKYP